MKVIVCGSRTFNDYPYLKEKLTEILSKLQYTRVVPISDIEIVSGGANGTDKFGEKFSLSVLRKQAKMFPITSSDWLDMSPPVWPKYRKDGTQYNALAGNKRNEKMADYAGIDGVVIGFIKGESRGTKNMIFIGKSRGMKTFKVDVERDKIHEFN